MDMDVILYTTGCPKCNVLKTKLNNKEIPYTEITDINLMKEKGFYQVPMLEVNGQVMDFTTANNWLNSYT